MNGRTASESPPRNSWHVDLGALSERVTGLEASLGRLFNQIDGLSRKLDSKPTNVWIVLGSLGAAFTVVGGAIGFLLSPVNASLDRHEREISHFAESMINRTDYLRDRDKADRERDKADTWNASLRDRQRFDEDNAVSQRQISELKDRFDERYRITSENEREKFARLENRVDQIDAQLVKRPEIESQSKAEADAREAATRTINARVDVLSMRDNAIQAQLEAMFPPGKVLDQIWGLLRDAIARTSVHAGAEKSE